MVHLLISLSPLRAKRAIVSYKSNNYMRSKTENFMKSNREKLKKFYGILHGKNTIMITPKLLRILGAQISNSQPVQSYFITIHIIYPVEDKIGSNM